VALCGPRLVGANCTVTERVAPAAMVTGALVPPLCMENALPEEAVSAIELT
jgi:hypothetical protein